MRNDRKNYIFIDGQNFYLSAKRAFGLRFPDFDIRSVGEYLSSRVNPDNDTHIHFYIGTPIHRYSPHWTNFWNNKIDSARREGIRVTTRELRYLTETDPQAPGGVRVLSAREKGIDLRLGLDVIAAARREDCENILILSRDQDFQEVTEEVKSMSRYSGRDIGIWSAYPEVENAPSFNRGIDGTRQISIGRKVYMSCLD